MHLRPLLLLLLQPLAKKKLDVPGLRVCTAALHCTAADDDDDNPRENIGLGVSEPRSSGVQRVRPWSLPHGRARLAGGRVKTARMRAHY
eukprot:CAMPEP_0195006154 /NCGR_PEP_ID=MMETSP0326_2-20130528/6430_1 /TAXON_ID=2866 ORGANISM="Crypthecodinium cohnii, Strain Seligo" /NCGR_SAMPLE_ID=MMETSP0326_2 /ASSEMBLY_ACC=CAM_ASM_000348 /LENGTH=88 /DNA_ID=CAMNT_0040012749 /DNA_START=255 /DNA_END=521 /DNA_ORIENTATION=-